VLHRLAAVPLRDACRRARPEQPGEIRERAPAQLRIAKALDVLLGERAPVEVLRLVEMAAVVLDHGELRERARGGRMLLARGAQVDQARVDRRGEIAAASIGVFVGFALEGAEIRVRVGLRIGPGRSRSLRRLRLGRRRRRRRAAERGDRGGAPAGNSRLNSRHARLFGWSGVWIYPASFASRIPLNCQRASG
jgi:hypothetical protein